MLAVTRGWAEANAEALRRFVRAHVDTVSWLYDPANKEQAIQRLSTRTQLSAEDARSTYELYVEQERPFPLGMRINLGGVQGVLDSLVEMGDLTQPTPPPSRYVDASYVDRYGQ